MPAITLQPRERLASAGLWLLVLAPVIACGWLVRDHAIDQRFLDDWIWAQDLLLWKEGNYRELLHNLFSVHLEHRPVVARSLAFVVTIICNGDVRAQVALTFLWLVIAFAGLCFLWMKRGGLTIREAWPPLLLAAAVFFTPMQWQTLLWPICHETTLPVMFFILAMISAFKSWPWWVRGIAGSTCAVLAMLSFASGFLMWILPLPVFLLCGSFQKKSQRFWFIALWAAVLALTMLLYLQVNVQRHDSITIEKTLLPLGKTYDLTYDLHNEVPSPYAYGHSEENTMKGEMDFFSKNPSLDVQFMASFCGTILARGWSYDLKNASTRVGWFLIAGLGAAALYFWRHRQDGQLRDQLLPMLCLGAYTPATGLMVAMGRINAGGMGVALNGRYAPHQTPLIVALVGTAFFIGRHRQKKLAGQTQPASSIPLVWVLGGALAGVVGLGWLHGSQLMREWAGARLAAAAAQHLSQVFGRYNKFVSNISGSYNIAVDTAADLDKHGLLKHGLAKTRNLSIFTMAEMEGLNAKQKPRQSQFERLYKNESGNWRVQGFTILPGQVRPADAILFAYQKPGEGWIMFGFTQSHGLPNYIARSLVKDMYAIIPGRNPLPNSMMGPWDPEVYIEEVPPPGSRITAWALDMQAGKIYRVNRTQHGKPDSPDGATLEEIAREPSDDPDDDA
ncbi:MAG: hypothetical protein WCN98_02965 [Verrucomicrobiaceae bacterium]